MAVSDLTPSATLPEDGDELPGSASCLRILRQELHTFFDAETGLPNHKAFEPSTQDKARTPVRVSVYDEARTSCAEAVAIRRKVATKPSRYVGYAFAVSDAVAAGDMYGVAVRVVRDLGNVTPEIAAMPGANGHCGVEGLESDAAPDPDTARAVRDELAFRCIERCREVPDDTNEDAGTLPP